MRHPTRRSRGLMKFYIMRSSLVGPIFHLMNQSTDIYAGFLIYCAAVTVFAVFMIYKVAPKYGKKNPLIYLSICSTVGSVSVMFIKALGIAVKLTIGGSNQFTNPSTYVFLILCTVCIMTQMNYFNKALSQFPTSM